MAPNNKKSKSSTRQKSMNKIFYAIALIVIVVVAAGVTYAVVGNSTANKAASPTPTPTPTSTSSSTTSTSPTDNSEYSASSTKVLLHTSAGDITIELRNDKPITTSNFINLIKKGTYDNTIFHRVIAGFMIQGGDPTEQDTATHNSHN